MTDRHCLFVVQGEGRCWREAEVLGYCRLHIGSAPEEQAAISTLTAKLQSAKNALDELGEHILSSYALPEHPEAIPEELRRTYRAAWYRHNYLVNVRNGRRPGDPLPAEVTMQ